MSKKIIFFGNHNVGYECLKFLINKGFNIVCVVVNEGEKNKLRWYNSVWKLAAENNLEILDADEIIDKKNINRIKKVQPDFHTDSRHP